MGKRDLAPIGRGLRENSGDMSTRGTVSVLHVWSEASHPFLVFTRCAMPTADPAFEAAMTLAVYRRGIPEPLDKIFVAWNLCFKAYCDRYDRPWPDHRSVPSFIAYLRRYTAATPEEVSHAVDAVIFGLDETTGLAGPLRVALRARVMPPDAPQRTLLTWYGRPSTPKASEFETGEHETGEHETSGDGAPRAPAALTRVMVAVNEEAFGTTYPRP